MSKVIYEKNYKILHTDSVESWQDVSFQKTAWPIHMKQEKLANLKAIGWHYGIPMTKLAVLSYGTSSEESGSPRVITVAESDPLDRTGKDGNAIITNIDDIVLMGWAADCCLVALSDEAGITRAIVHCSVESLASQDIVKKTIRTMDSLYGVAPLELRAYVGACVRECCYEYDPDKAQNIFGEKYAKHIYVRDGKTTLDLNGAVRQALQDAGVKKISNIYDSSNQCTICSKDENGKFKFHSYRRETCEDREGKLVHYNGQYGLMIGRI